MPFSEKIKVHCEDNGTIYKSDIKLITTDLKKALEFGDYIFITYPAFLFERYSKELLPLLSKKHHLFFVPGSGGADLWFKPAVDKGVTITGLQRVHSVARIVEPGALAKESGIRKGLKAASIPNSYNKEACAILSELYSLPVEPLDNYLNVTLINSNPILHTARLFSIFHDYPNRIMEYDSLPLFYEEWDMETSLLLNKMDNELFDLINHLKKHGLNINQIVPLLEHYESKNEEQMVKKLRSIKSLQGLTTPSIKNENNKLIPDLKSRYFTADFPYGLDILISFCKYFGSPCDSMIMVSNWYHGVVGDETKFNLCNFFKNEEDMIKYYK